MPYYRVDKRLFSVGEKITTAQEYYDRFTGVAKVVEDSLEANRPASKEKRTSCLFVFDDLACARKHWSKMNDGKLYVVAIDDRSILHCGDMALMDEMRAQAEKGGDITVLAQAYWRGENSIRPDIELMVPSAMVTEVLSTSDAERLNHLKGRWGIQR